MKPNQSRFCCCRYAMLTANLDGVACLLELEAEVVEQVLKEHDLLGVDRWLEQVPLGKYFDCATREGGWRLRRCLLCNVALANLNAAAAAATCRIWNIVSIVSIVIVIVVVVRLRLVLSFDALARRYVNVLERLNARLEIARDHRDMLAAGELYDRFYSFFRFFVFIVLFFLSCWWRRRRLLHRHNVECQLLERNRRQLVHASAKAECSCKQ